MLIAGSFREYPFSLLLEIFLRRKETGLLEVSSTEESGYFYIKNGKVKDGRIGKSKGLAALKLVGKFDDGSFRFKPLEPADYARIVWQRSFGPTAPAISQPALSGLSIADKLRQSGFNAQAVNRLLNSLSSVAHQALRQFLLYTSTANQGLQRIELFLQRRTVSGAVAGLDLWRRARIGTRLLQILMRALAALLEDKRRREREAKYRYPRKVSFQVPAIPSGTATGATRQHELEHNIIFVLTMTILLALSGLLLRQLLFENQDATDPGVAVEEQTEIPASATHSKPKPKQPRRKRPSINTRDKTTDALN